MTDEDLKYLNALSKKLSEAKKELKATNSITAVKFVSGGTEGGIKENGQYSKQFKQIKKILVDIAAKSVLELQQEFDAL